MGFRRFFKKDGTEAVVNKLKYYFLSKSGDLTEYADKATAEAAVSDPEDRIKLSGSKGDFRRADDLDENITVLTRIKANVDMSNVNLTNALAAEGYSGGADKVPYVSWNHAAGSLGSFAEGSSIGSIDCGGQSGIDGSAITGASVTAGSLPSGVTLASNGALSGTMPEQTASSTFTFTVSLTTGSNTSTREFTITNTADNDAPVWSTSAGALTAAGVSAYTKTLSATDPEGEDLTYSVQSGSIPTWASMSTSGIITGTPNAWGTNASFTLRVTDVTGAYADRSFTLATTNNAPIWSTSAGSLSDCTGAYSVTLSTSDPEGGAITYSLQSGSLPAGLSLNTSSGLISGTGTSLDGSTVSFTIRASDAQGATTDRSFSIAQISPDFVISNLSSEFPGATYIEPGNSAVRYETPGSYTFTVKSGMDELKIWVIGGGGSSGAWRSRGGGGGAGCILTKTVSAGQSFTIVVGARSGQSSFANDVLCNGGSVGGGGGYTNNVGSSALCSSGPTSDNVHAPAWGPIGSKTLYGGGTGVTHGGSFAWPGGGYGGSGGDGDISGNGQPQPGWSAYGYGSSENTPSGAGAYTTDRRTGGPYGAGGGSHSYGGSPHAGSGGVVVVQWKSGILANSSTANTGSKASHEGGDNSWYIVDY